MMKKILIVDDHPIIRDGLKRILAESGDVTVGGEAGSAEEALRRVREGKWDLVVLDISLPGRSGLDLLRELRQLRPALPVLILSMHTEDELALRAFRSGASGYLTKDRAQNELLRAIRLVLSGQNYISRVMADKLIAELQAQVKTPPHERLSDREYEIMRLIASGKSPKEIASTLTLSGSTVSTYRRRILGKLALKTNAEITRYALSRGLVE